MYITRTALDNITFDEEGILLDGQRIPGNVIGSDVRIVKHRSAPTSYATVTLTLYTEHVSVEKANTNADIVISHK